MSSGYPQFWDKWEGRVIKVLVSHGNEPVLFDTLAAETKLGPKGLLRALAPLFQKNIIQKDGNRYLLINEDIKKEWVAFLQAPALKQAAPKIITYPTTRPTRTILQQAPAKSDNDLVNWITQWRSMNNLTFPLESKHFFLEGIDLDELARGLIGKAQDKILITNPYVDSCHLTTALERAIEKNIKIKIVTRCPDVKEAKKLECHSNLKKAGMLLHYNSQIHAKIIVIDNKVAIISSMNLYSGSSGGATIEAGMVSIDEKVAQTVTNYILTLLEKPESKEANNTNNYNWRT